MPQIKLFNALRGNDFEVSLKDVTFKSARASQLSGDTAFCDIRIQSIDLKNVTQWSDDVRESLINLNCMITAHTFDDIQLLCGLLINQYVGRNNLTKETYQKDVFTRGKVPVDGEDLKVFDVNLQLRLA